MASFGDFAATHGTQTIFSFSQLACDEKIYIDVATMTKPNYFIPPRIGQVQNDDDAV